MGIPTKSKYRNQEELENILDLIEGAPRMTVFLEDIPYPKEVLKNSQEKISNLKLVKLMERGVISEPKPAVFFTDEPKFPAFFTAPSNSEKLREDQCGSSLDLIAEKAVVRAMAEAVERYCLRNLHGRLFGTYEDLSKNNVLSDVIKVDKKSDFSWTEVFDVKKKDFVFIPSQLVYVPSNFSDFFDNEPVINIPTSNGAAFGDSYEMAIYNGLLEVIERDATMISWLAKRELSRIDLDTELTKKLDNYFNQYNLKLNVFEATTDLEVPVMITMIRDKTGLGPAISVGAGCSLNAEKAVIKSILEAQQGRIWIRASYLAEGRPDIKPSDIVDMKTRGFYWYDESKLSELDFLLKNNKGKKLLIMDNQESDNLQENLENISRRILKKGYNLFVADISSVDVKKVGSRVVKVVCPELQPFYLNENFPVYSKRLENYVQGPVNKVPHPVI